MSYLFGIIFMYVIYRWGKWFFNVPTVDKIFISINGLWMFFIAGYIWLFSIDYMFQMVRSIRGLGSDIVWNMELVSWIAFLTIMLLITNIIRFAYSEYLRKRENKEI